MSTCLHRSSRWPALLLALFLGALPLVAPPAPMLARGAAIQAAAPAGAAGGTLAPRAEKSVRFAVIGDSGTGDKPQYQVGERLAESRSVFPFEFVLMLGDNIYGGERPEDFVRKFERPYKALLDLKIPFYASLGNHDDPNQRFYKPFNMDGKRFYTFEKDDVRFFALDSNYMDQAQVEWVEKELSASKNTWKIAYFHHPLYSSGARHGSEVDLRELLEPLFSEVAEVDWVEHIPKLIDYWCWILLGQNRYPGHVTRAHRHLHGLHAIEPRHCDRWFSLWVACIDERWSGPNADHAKRHAETLMAGMAKRIFGYIRAPPANDRTGIPTRSD